MQDVGKFTTAASGQPEDTNAGAEGGSGAGGSGIKYAWTSITLSAVHVGLLGVKAAVLYKAQEETGGGARMQERGARY